MFKEPNNREKIDKNFALVIKIFQEHKIPHWICHGTLLGVIRDKKLIEWDHDIDIAIWDKTISKKRLIEIMISNNFIVKPTFFVGDGMTSFEKAGGRPIDIHCYQIAYNKIKNRDMAVVFMKYVPKNIYLKFIDAMSMAKKYHGKFKYLIRMFSIFQFLFEFIKSQLIKKNMFYNAIGYCEPLELFKEFKKIDFFGTKLTIPYKPEEYLRYIYGENWKIPVKNYLYADEHANDPTVLIR